MYTHVYIYILHMGVNVYTCIYIYIDTHIYSGELHRTLSSQTSTGGPPVKKVEECVGARYSACWLSQICCVLRINPKRLGIRGICIDIDRYT